MLGGHLARSLEDDWQATLDAVARARGWAGSSDVARLGADVAALSRSYNEGRPRSGDAHAMAARLGFSFARDVPKSAGAARELIASGALAPLSELTVLDVGAGLGASTWGLARALEAAGHRPQINATFIEPDALAASTAEAIVRARGETQLRIVETKPSLTRLANSARFDVVLLGQVLSEMNRELDDGARLARHVELVSSLLARVNEGGALIVIEPALRDRTRHLHRVRDALLAAKSASVFAPCIHHGACPALDRETDWCHEDLAVDLPSWLVPVARTAGLRWEGLTFSYLVLRAPGAQTLRDRAPVQLRVVSERFATKGKSEAFLCGELGASSGRVRAMRLDRDENDTNAAWEDLKRGDLVSVEPPLDPARPRIGKGSSVRVT